MSGKFVRTNHPLDAILNGTLYGLGLWHEMCHISCHIKGHTARFPERYAVPGGQALSGFPAAGRNRPERLGNRSKGFRVLRHPVLHRRAVRRSERILEALRGC